MTIGERIKNRRIELGLSVDEIAAKLEKNRATIYRYESNDIENLPTTVLEPLAEALRTTPAFLMGWEDDSFKEDSQEYINDPEAQEYLNELHKRPEMRTLFQVGRKASKKDIETAISLIEVLKKKREGEDD